MASSYSNVKHYNLGGIECIDVMEAISTPEEFEGFLKLNTFKYIYRANDKDTKLSNIRKAHYYLTKLLDTLEKTPAANLS